MTRPAEPAALPTLRVKSSFPKNLPEMKWLPKTADAEHTQSLAAALFSSASLRLKTPDVAATLARLLLMRGIRDPETAEHFLAPSLAHLHSPYLMSGMKTAVDRLDAAIERKEGILIYGDYDVDGTTAIVILKTAIELCGGSADFHVPHRIKEGYDLRGDVIERAAAAGIHLIISVDTGIRAFAAAETAHRLGVDLIVTDHHLPGPDGMPIALAVLNPNQPGCEYPSKALCGAGVAFKLAQALMERRLAHRDQVPLLKSFMKVVAIATIADSVPLTGENRVFTKLGLEALRSAVNPGLKALLDVAQVSGRPLTSGEVGFRIAPRINAAGRMDVARDVIELFSVKDPTRAREIANKLDQLNSDRQNEERKILDAIDSRLEQDPALLNSFCLVIDGDGWHRGVIGITATRVVERYCRPTLVICRDGTEAYGSGRSIRAFHLLNALESCAPLFTRFGGHAHAVGFSMPAANLPELCAHLDTYARAKPDAGRFRTDARSRCRTRIRGNYARFVSGDTSARTFWNGQSRTGFYFTQPGFNGSAPGDERKTRQTEIVVTGAAAGIKRRSRVDYPAMSSRFVCAATRLRSEFKGKAAKTRHLHGSRLAHGRTHPASRTASRRRVGHRVHPGSERSPRLRRAGTFTPRFQEPPARG